MTTRTMRASKRWMVAAAAVAVGASALVSTSASAGPDEEAPDAFRLSGENRFGTAADVNSSDTPGPTPPVPADPLGLNDDDLVIANGFAFPDGLTGSVFGDAILLTETDELPAETLAEIERIEDDVDEIDNIYVVGGTAAVSSAVFEELAILAPDADVTRLAGVNRYETALEVAAEYDDNFGDVSQVIIATGLNFPDALAAGPLAAYEGAPILLNDGPALRADVQAFLISEAVTDVYIVGGESAVPASVEAQLEGPLGIDVTRLSGPNRDATAVAIAEELIDIDSNFAEGVVAVNRSGFADALAAGPFALEYEAPILLVGADSIPAATAEFHVTNCAEIEDIFAVGGTAVISNAVVEGAVGAATCTGPDLLTATLVVDDLTAREVTLTGAGGDTTLTAVGPALGTVANFWTIIFEADADPDEQGAVIDDTATPPSITYTDNFVSLTAAQFAANWNDSDAGTLFEADAGTGTFGGAPTTVAPNTGTLGSFDATVVATFNTEVESDLVAVGTEEAPDVYIFNNISPVTGSQLLDPAAADIEPAPYPEDGADVVTFTWDDVDGLVPAPVVGVGSARVFDGEIRDSVTNLDNDGDLIVGLTAP